MLRNTHIIICLVALLGLSFPVMAQTDTLCLSSTSNNYYVINTPGSTYLWDTQGDGIINSGQGTSTANITWPQIAGNYVLSVTETNSDGCVGDPQSINIIIVPSSSSTDVRQTCGPFSWIDGITYTTSTNTPTFTLSNAAGCDSVITLNLTIDNFTTGVDVISSCNPITWIDGNTYSASNNNATFTIVGGSAQGCDSVITLNFTLLQSSSSTDVQQSCGPFTWIDGITYSTSTNTPTFTLSNAAGCDSVVTLNLSISPSLTASENISICDGQLPYSWNGNSYAAAGLYSITLSSSAGCDSLVNLNLSVTPAVTASENISVCDAQLPYSWNGNAYAAAGSYSVTLSSLVGCDSVVTLNLFIQPNDTTYTAITICLGDTASMPDGSIATSEGIYHFTFINASGCDSVIQVNLSADDPITLTLSGDTAICLGESAALSVQGASTYAWTPTSTLSSTQGQSVTATPKSTTTYIVVGQNGSCFDSDSITVNVLPLPELTSSLTEIVLCEEDSVSIEAFGADYYVWNANNSVSIACDTCPANLISPIADDSLIITGYLGQCSSVLNIPVNVYDRPNAQISGDSILCLGDTVTYIGSGGITFLWSTGDTTSSIILPPLVSGSLELVAYNPACADTAYLEYNVYASPIAQVFTEDTTITLGNSIQLQGFSNAQYNWNPSNTLNCDNCLDPIAMPEGTTTYCLTSVNAYGCSASDCVVITVDTLCENMFIPNVFAPDDKGHNANNCFRIYGGDCISTMTMVIYSRWGEKVFEATNTDQCWDGTFHNKPMNTDVFVYLLEAELITGEKISRQGNLTLLR